MSDLTHFDERGNARMVDVSGKDITKRTATAQGVISVSREVMDAVIGKKIKKGQKGKICSKGKRKKTAMIIKVI